MSLVQIIKAFILIHAALGGIALVSGLISMSVIKGGKNHKLSGKVFFYSMTSSAIIALVVSLMPNHENPFLFTIGVFTLYLVITGFAALRFKTTTVNLRIDKIISWTMIITGIGMILFPILMYQKLNIILTVFGTIGIIFALLDLKRYQKPETLKEHWLILHLTKIIGGYIAAATAFIVVTQLIPGIYGWLLPTLLGSFVIGYWVRRVKKGRRTS